VAWNPRKRKKHIMENIIDIDSTNPPLKLSNRLKYRFKCLHCNKETIKMGRNSKWFFYCAECNAHYCNRLRQINRSSESKEQTKKKIKQNWAQKTEEEKALRGKHISEAYKNRTDQEIELFRERNSIAQKNIWSSNHEQIMRKRKVTRELHKDVISKKFSDAQLSRSRESVENSIKKSNETKLKKYGKLNFKNKYYYDNNYFDSSWEIAFWIFHKDHNNIIIRSPVILNYIYNDKLYNYEVDFMVNNQLYEIKGDNLLKQMISNPESKQYKKYECMLQNNIKILTFKDIKPILQYIKDKYGMSYLNQFKI
jgi:hypothetical protein